MSSALLIHSLSKKRLGWFFFSFFPTCLFFLFFWKQAVRSKPKKSIAHPCKSHHKTLQFYKQVTEFKLQSDWYLPLLWLCMFILCVGREEGVLWINSDFLQCVSIISLCCVVLPCRQSLNYKVWGCKLLTMMKWDNENPASFAMPWDVSACGSLWWLCSSQGMF